MVAGVFVATLLEHPSATGGWYWDIGNGLGYLALSGSIIGFLSPGIARHQRAHQWTGYCTALLIIAHVLWLWVPNPTLWHYLTPDGPWYMHIALVSTALMGTSILLAVKSQRRRWHDSYPAFQRWHYWLAVATLVSAYLHIYGSAFYLGSMGLTLLAIVTASALAYPRTRPIHSAVQPATAPALYLVGCAGLLAFIARAWL